MSMHCRDWRTIPVCASSADLWKNGMMRKTTAEDAWIYREGLCRWQECHCFEERMIFDYHRLIESKDKEDLHCASTIDKARTLTKDALTKDCLRK